ncbi:hypothetical protein [Ruegeria sp. EL01]|uniref:hypothetical protein n=1 Tax=Ruegeria sp. EL01 TaxID=2107578 RepID=UPI000EA80ACE|nr:hypothetical protein [Ruegeria sp. EL01]
MKKIQLVTGIGAAALAALHTFVGTPEVADPLLASALEARAKYLNFFCWHIVTIVLWAVAAGYLWSAIVRHSTELVVFLTIMMACIGIWGVLLPPSVGLSYVTMPQGWLFFPIVALAIFGLRNGKQRAVEASA